MPAEFGGGIIEIETKPVPTERILDFSFSSGFNDATSLSDGLYMMEEMMMILDMMTA